MRFELITRTMTRHQVPIPSIPMQATQSKAKMKKKMYIQLLSLLVCLLVCLLSAAAVALHEKCVPR